jgi:hypothetical protein
MEVWDELRHCSYARRYLAAHKRFRIDYPVSVRARCGHCGRPLAVVYGHPHAAVVWSNGVAHGRANGYGRTIRWYCKAGHDHPLRVERLEAAFLRVAALPKRQRVVRVPQDL